jgi:hypothetical protein
LRIDHRACLLSERSVSDGAVFELQSSTAGKPGDRWASLRKKASREESPDTVISGAQHQGLKSAA